MRTEIPKLDISVFDEAAELISAGCEFGVEFSCHAFSFQDGNTVNELRFYKEMFQVNENDYATFNEKMYVLDGKFPDDKTIEKVRVMALCLAAELARLQNNKKFSFAQAFKQNANSHL